MKKYLLISILLFFVVSDELFSKITISAVSDIKLNGKFPNFSVELKADSNGIPIEITALNLIIQEVNYSNTPKSVEKTSNDSYIVKWNSNLRNKSTYAYFYLTHGNEVGYIALEYPQVTELPILNLIRNPDSDVPMLFFHTQLIEPKDTRKIVLQTNSNLPIIVDSIVLDSPDDFAYRIIFPQIGRDKCPFNIKEVVAIMVDFTGKENRLYQNRIVFYYNGGQVAFLDLVANSYRVTTKSNLTITEPKPGDVLTPCIKDTIKWRGGMPGAITYIQYSSDNGSSWDVLASTHDSLWVGIISDNPTEKGLIRIYQSFKESKDYPLSVETGYSKVKFTDDAQYLIAATNNARIMEWKIDQSAAQNTPTVAGPMHIIGEYAQPEEIGSFVELSYISNDKISGKREFAAIYTPYQFARVSGMGFDSLYFFNNASANPEKAIKLKYRVAQAETDPKYRWLAILPNISNKIDFFSTITKTIEYEFVAKSPIRSFSFTAGGDSIIIALQNNTIEVYDISVALASNQLKNKLDFSIKPLIDKIAYSPDGKFLAFSTAFPPEDPDNQINLLQTSRTHIYEVSTDIMINSYFGENSEALGVNFNPSSSRLVRASAKPEHIKMYDLSLGLSADYFTISGSDIIAYDFATEGHNIGAISDNGVLHLHKFVYTESDVVDGVFKIRYPETDTNYILIPDRYIDNELDTISLNNLCNIGTLPFIINNVKFKYGINFTIKPIALPDTINPNQCFDFGYVFNPKDTGAIVDTLIVNTCAQTFYIPFTSKGLPRTFQYYPEEYDFGEECLDLPKIKRVKLLRNLDPVPLRINRAVFQTENNSAFIVLTNYYDTLHIVQPNEDYYVDIRFTPKKRGLNTGVCLIKHSNQEFMIPQKQFEGIGLGSDVELSHTQLRFIPEIPNRKFTIQNLENTPLTIEEYQFSLQNAYKIIYPTAPIIIAPKEKIEIEVQCLTSDPQFAELVIKALPCLANAKIEFNRYTGESIIQIEDTEADPRGKAIIKIKANSKEMNPYQGERFFEAELSINPNIFIVDTEQAIKSDYGIGKLINQKVEDGKRKIKFRIDGEFPMDGIIAEIHGLAGLTNPPSSPMELLPTSQFFGKNITTVSKPGVFKLINLCEDKYLYTQNTIITVKSIAPNPVQDMINLNIDSKVETLLNIEIYNSMGILVKHTDKTTVIIGENTISIDSHSLNNGQYQAVIKGNNIETVFSFIVLKY